jgi:hypothetical protein
MSARYIRTPGADVATNTSYHAETLRRSHRYEQRRKSFLRRVVWYWLAAVVLVSYTLSQVLSSGHFRPSVALLIVCWIAWILAWPRYPHGR